MDIKMWTPFPYLDRDWHFDFPRLARETERFSPSIDVVKKDGQLHVTAELPGMASDDLGISLDGNILSIKGEKTDEREVEEDDRYIHERSFGAFRRQITVPDGVTPDSISAAFDNGILTLEIKFPEEKALEPQHIPVKTGKAA